MPTWVTTIITLAWLGVASLANALVPSQCAEYVDLAHELRHEHIAWLKVIRGNADLNDARAALDEAEALADEAAGKSGNLNTRELFSEAWQLVHAHQKAAIMYEDVATQMAEELAIARKESLTLFALVTCLQSN